MRGVASAQLNLGFLYLQGRGTRKDPAAYSLAVLYLRGEMVPKNIPRAVTLLKRALGSYDMIPAYNLLATVYGRGYLGRPDHKQAVDTLQPIPPNRWMSPPLEPGPDLPLFQLLPPVEIGNRQSSEPGLPRLEEADTWRHAPIRLGLYSLAAALGGAQAKQLFDRVARAISPTRLKDD